jgi:hypothetical protein
MTGETHWTSVNDRQCHIRLYQVHFITIPERIVISIRSMPRWHPPPNKTKKNQNKQTNKQTDKTKKQYMVMEQRSFGHKIRFYRSYFPSLVQSSMKITTCTVNVFFSFFPCDIFFEICTFVSWIHQVLVSYPGLVNISKAHNI